MLQFISLQWYYSFLPCRSRSVPALYRELGYITDIICIALHCICIVPVWCGLARIKMSVLWPLKNCKSGHFYGFNETATDNDFTLGDTVTIQWGAYTPNIPLNLSLARPGTIVLNAIVGTHCTYKHTQYCICLIPEGHPS
jgi:hypothetical protein